ncbi:CBS domain-containing protein [Streptosporangium roseum]|uniref:CBS domain-containing protein n=1 Tax=Streptosporangium roseum TaxID=2001 RepID=UPI0004CD2697|nr:CBS domain-containing protein [Streptosporangium roseum]
MTGIDPAAPAPGSHGEEHPPQIALRVGDVPTARNDVLVSVSPADTLERAYTLMTQHDYSQLPVLSGTSFLRGVVTLESIAIAWGGGARNTVTAAMRPAEIVRVEASLQATIPLIRDKGYVFVLDGGQAVCGIITASDILAWFEELTGAYLTLGEIERRLRLCVDRMCPSVEELREATGRRTADATHDLDLGGIENAFKKPGYWNRLGWIIEQEAFVAELSMIRKIRNKVMHFQPGSPIDEERKRLDGFVNWLRRIDPQV